MLTRLFISNYALIDELAVSFEPGFNIVTGETGAGKSIILGALSLILGARAESVSIRIPEKKCVVEGTFAVDGYGLESLFAANDLDFDNVTILRREILPSGKSRAFVNDTPVNLPFLRELTLRLVDIHSQHQNLELGNHLFQLNIVDAVAQTAPILRDYKSVFEGYNQSLAALRDIREKALKAKADLDYYAFQHSQLADAHLTEGEQSTLEEEREMLTHAEEIKGALVYVSDLLDGEQFPALSQLKDALHRMEKIRHFLKEAEEIRERLDSIYIELQDIASEVSRLADRTEYNPDRLARVTERLDLLYTLEQKHQVSSIEELILLRDSLAARISEIADFDEEIVRLEKEAEVRRRELENLSLKLRTERKTMIPQIEKQVIGVLQQLGIPQAVFRVECQPLDSFTPQGADTVQFLFSANKNGTPDEISKIASGGEISRLMLALKTLVSGSRMLPTIIFDEIDAGISGDIALKMASILKQLSGGIQVINITHLPQIAGKGDHHYKVYKSEDDKAAFTRIRKLSNAERIDELASMLGGNNPSETARQAAVELMQ